MNISVYLNNAWLATAALEQYGLLTASLVRTWRHPERTAPGLLSVVQTPEIVFRLGGVHQSDESDAPFVVITCPVAPGDVLRLCLDDAACAQGVSGARDAVVAEYSRLSSFDVRVDEELRYRSGVSGYGLMSALLVHANRHPDRLLRKNGESLPQRVSELMVSAHDDNDAGKTVQSTWPRCALSSRAIVELHVGEHAEVTTPESVREHS